MKFRTHTTEEMLLKNWIHIFMFWSIEANSFSHSLSWIYYTIQYWTKCFFEPQNFLAPQNDNCTASYSPSCIQPYSVIEKCRGGNKPENCDKYVGLWKNTFDVENSINFISTLEYTFYVISNTKRIIPCGINSIAAGLRISHWQCTLWPIIIDWSNLTFPQIQCLDLFIVGFLIKQKI